MYYRYIEEGTEDEDDVPPFPLSTLKENEERIRGQFMAICTFERLPHECCRFTYIAKADIRGSVPKVVADSGLAGMVDSVRQASNYFERDAEVDELERDEFIRLMEYVGRASEASEPVRTPAGPPWDLSNTRRGHHTL